MARWTNQRWVSTLHRVVLPPRDVQGSCRRQSMAFFHNINPDHIVECIPSCTSAENPPRFPPIKALASTCLFCWAQHARPECTEPNIHEFTRRLTF